VETWLQAVMQVTVRGESVLEMSLEGAVHRNVDAARENMSPLRPLHIHNIVERHRSDSIMLRPFGGNGSRSKQQSEI
jgi:hypothetical protein